RSRSPSTAHPRRCAATIAATRSRSPPPVAPVGTTRSGCAASAPNNSSTFSSCGSRRRAWRAWIWTRPAASGRITAFWNEWPGAAAHHSVAEFAAAELPLRAPPQPAYPPHVGLARFLAAAPEEAAAQRAAERVAAWLRRASAEKLAGALTVLGPAPCPIPRLQ